MPVNLELNLVTVVSEREPVFRVVESEIVILSMLRTRIAGSNPNNAIDYIM